ncbi:MAG: hypothetical protein WAK35_18075, partial [Xanthobacteraceae bacterium]
EQDHIPLRAAAFESAQHDRKRESRTKTWIFGPRCHLERRLSYWDSNRNSHDADVRSKPELARRSLVVSATLTGNAQPTLINFNALAIDRFTGPL